MRDTLQLVRKDDNDALFRAAAAGAVKVVLSELAWAVPIDQPNDVRKVNLYKSIASNNVIPVSFRMRQCETFSLPRSRIYCMAIRCLVCTRKTSTGTGWIAKEQVVIRRRTLLFLIIATLRICRCG